MDCLSCLDWVNSCVWGNFVSTILMIIGFIGGIFATTGALLGLIFYTVSAFPVPFGGRIVVTLGALLGSILSTIGCCFGGICATAGTSLGWFCLATLGAFIGCISSILLNYLAGYYIIDSFIDSFVPFASFFESFFHNLIWICGAPVVVRAAYMEGCMEEFLKACRDLISHLLGMGDE